MGFDLIVQTPIDSVAAGMGTEAGAFIAAQVAAGLGIAAKFATDLFLKIKGMHDTLPAAVKPFIALAISTGLVVVNKFTLGLGGPEVTSELVIPALLAWGTAMGFNSLLGVFKKKK